MFDFNLVRLPCVNIWMHLFAGQAQLWEHTEAEVIDAVDLGRLKLNLCDVYLDFICVIYQIKIPHTVLVSSFLQHYLKM